MIDIDNVDETKLQELAQELYEWDGHGGDLYESYGLDGIYESKALDYIDEHGLEQEYSKYPLTVIANGTEALVAVGKMSLLQQSHMLKDIVWHSYHPRHTKETSESRVAIAYNVAILLEE